jgi:hypothetical protein
MNDEIITITVPKEPALIPLTCVNKISPFKKIYLIDYQYVIFPLKSNIS